MAVAPAEIGLRLHCKSITKSGRIHTGSAGFDYTVIHTVYLTTEE